MMFKEVLGDAYPLIEKLAPAFAAALTSPLGGAMALTAVNLLSTAFGINPKEVKKLGETIVNDPEADSILENLEDLFSSMLHQQWSVKCPAKVEFNVKLEWN
jgi:hypothetical protein